MKKLLLVLLGLIVVFIIVQKAGLLNYFSNNNQPVVKEQLTIAPTGDISPVISRFLLGIRYRMIDKQTADQNNLVEGAYITQIIKESPAEKADLQEEDIITEVDGNKIGGGDEQILINLITLKKPGEKVDLKIWRNNVIKAISVTLKSAQ